MREEPGQPSNLNAEDRENLAVLGHRTERWDILNDTSIPLEERKALLIADLQTDMDRLIELGDAHIANRKPEKAEKLSEQIGTLADEIEVVKTLTDDPEVLKGFSQERREWYTKARKHYRIG